MPGGPRRWTTCSPTTGRGRTTRRGPSPTSSGRPTELPRVCPFGSQRDAPRGAAARRAAARRERERRVVELSLRLVTSMYFLGRMDESEEILTALAPRVTAMSDTDLACSYHFWAAHTASHLGKPDDAERAARTSLDLAEHLGDGSAVGRALYIRTRQGWWTGGSRRECRRGRGRCRSSNTPGRPGGSGTATSSSPIRSTRWAGSTARSRRPPGAGRSGTPWRIPGCGAGRPGPRA